MKREIPLLLAFLSGLGMILAFFIPTPFFKQFEVMMSNWVQIVTAFAIFLALFSLIRIHGERISRQESGYSYSVVLLATLFITTASGIFYGVTDYYPDYVVLEKAEADQLIAVSDKWAAAKTTSDKEWILGVGRLDDHWSALHPAVVTIPPKGTAPSPEGAASVAPPSPEEVERLTKELAANKEQAVAVAGMLGTHRTVTLARNLDEIGVLIKGNKEAGKLALLPREGGNFSGKYVVKVSYFNIFQWLYEYVYTPLQATMFSLLAFYMASAAFRAFRARTIEGTLLLTAAFLVMIGRVSFGYWLNQHFCSLPFPAIQDWIMEVPTTAGQRAIMIGAALGVVSASLRMLLGLEQTYLGGE